MSLLVSLHNKLVLLNIFWRGLIRMSSNFFQLPLTKILSNAEGVPPRWTCPRMVTRVSKPKCFTTSCGENVHQKIYNWTDHYETTAAEQRVRYSVFRCINVKLIIASFLFFQILLSRCQVKALWYCCCLFWFGFGSWKQYIQVRLVLSLQSSCLSILSLNVIDRNHHTQTTEVKIFIF